MISSWSRAGAPSPARRFLACLALLLAVGLTLEHLGLGLALPTMRTWSVLLPVLHALWLLGLESVGQGLVARGGRRLGQAWLLAWLLHGLLVLSLWDSRTYWEWPDQAVLPQAVAVIEHDLAGRTATVSVGHSWYYDAVLTTASHQSASHWQPVVAQTTAHDYLILSHAHLGPAVEANYEVLADFPRHQVIVMRHRPAPL